MLNGFNTSSNLWLLFEYTSLCNSFPRVRAVITAPTPRCHTEQAISSAHRRTPRPAHGAGTYVIVCNGLYASCKDARMPVYICVLYAHMCTYPSVMYRHWCVCVCVCVCVSLCVGGVCAVFVCGMCVCMCLSPSLCPSVCLSVCLPACLSVSLSVCLSLSLSLSLSLCSCRSPCMVQCRADRNLPGGCSGTRCGLLQESAEGKDFRSGLQLLGSCGIWYSLEIARAFVVRPYETSGIGS